MANLFVVLFMTADSKEGPLPTQVAVNILSATSGRQRALPSSMGDGKEDGSCSARYEEHMSKYDFIIDMYVIILRTFSLENEYVRLPLPLNHNMYILEVGR